MRSLGFALLVCVLVCGCRKSGTTAGTSASSAGITVEGPPPREVKPERPELKKKGGELTALPKIPLTGIFKPIPQRTTDELIEEVMHFSTKEHLPLLAELSKRTKDKHVVVAKMNLLQTDGRYHVRLTAANVAVTLDPEKAGKHAPMVSLATSNKFQNPTYGPIIENSPELTSIRKRIVPQLVQLLEKELAEANLYEQSLGALTILGTIPKEIGEPAIAVVKKVAATPMHPTAAFAKDTLKKWGIEI